MSDSDPKLNQTIVRFPNNIEHFNYRHVDPMGLGYIPRRTRFGGAVDDPGVRSPPLWKTSPPMSPKRNHQYYETLSPNSRTREIAKGRMEMMEMVRNMPESCYELSLKDLVEMPAATDQENGDTDRFSEEKARENGETMLRSGSSKRQNSIKKKNYESMRSGSIGNGGGFLLKMVFPVSSSLGSPKQKKVNPHGISSPAKVSPRPSLDGSAKGVGMDWWKKKGSGLEDGEKKEEFDYDKSIEISRSSSRRRRGRKGCWPLMRIKRSKSPQVKK